MGGEPSGIFLAKPEQTAEGIPLAVKDLFDTAGLTTTYGSIVYADHVPRETAEAVARLEAAGYANVGKTNLHEFAYGITSANPHYGTVPNPSFAGRWRADRVEARRRRSPGPRRRGARHRLGRLDSDPPACCGVVGFKPTYGLVSVEGVFPLAPSFDHVGPMARSVAECTAMMTRLADGFEPTKVESLEEVEVGIAWLDLADPLVQARVREASELFPRRREIDFPLAGRIGMRSCVRWRTSTVISSPSSPTRTATTCARSSSAAWQ